LTNIIACIILKSIGNFKETKMKYNTDHHSSLPGHKKCTKCGGVKLLEEFPPHKHTKDGKNSWCRVCSRKVVGHGEAGKVKEGVKRWHKKHPGAFKSHYTLNNLVRSGKIIRPDVCSRADNTCSGRIEAHHTNGYTSGHELDIVWLCTSHHKRLHR
jgi:hypothetical protein